MLMSSYYIIYSDVVVIPRGHILAVRREQPVIVLPKEPRTQFHEHNTTLARRTPWSPGALTPIQLHIEPLTGDCR